MRNASYGPKNWLSAGWSWNTESRALDHSIEQLSYRLQELQQGHQEYEQAQARMLIGLAKEVRIAHEHGYLLTVHATNESGLPTAIEVTHEETGRKWHLGDCRPDEDKDVPF